MKMGLLSMSLMAAVLLTGCDARAESLEWYKTHDDGHERYRKRLSHVNGSKA